MRRIDSAFGDDIGRALGKPVVTGDMVSGGDINRAFEFRLEDDTVVFVKTHPNPPPGMFAAEARGLQWLSETNTVLVPAVLAVQDDPDFGHRFLVLEWIGRRGAWTVRGEQDLGRALADLHRFPCATFGLDAGNYVATVAQDNTPSGDWADFYRSRRVEPLARGAIDRGLLPTDATAAFDRLYARLPDLVGPPEPPSRLHGDLWGGNAISDHLGRPWVIDPAVYGGHREIDLAMMKLFGGFGPKVFAAYDEAFPLADGHEQRVALYQLYPLLVHVHLFGGGYASSVLRALRAYT